MKEKAAANSTNPSIPAKAGISAAIAAFADRRPLQCSAFAEFPADAGRDSCLRRNGKGGGNGSVKKAGMEVRRRWEWKRNRKEIDGEIKKTSIPAKAGISAAKPHSPKATIAMFRFAENSRCRENEIPAFAGMEEGGNGRKGEWKKGGNEKVME